MKRKIFINPDFKNFEAFVENIPESFRSEENFIRRGRNEIKIVNVDGTDLVVKYFKRITLANRLIYATIRKSKAQRAYEHSEKINRKGFKSPEPVAYIDVYRRGTLDMSFYVSLYTDYKPIVPLFYLPIDKAEAAIKSFARYTFRLHRAGIFHGDYNMGNVLYSFNGSDYDYSLIDNNRMRFSKYSYNKGIRNIGKLNMPVNAIGIFVTEYANAARSEEIRTLGKIIMSIMRDKIRHNVKASFKKLIKFICHPR